MQGSSINPAILQPMLESATNAAVKGQSQFFTPLAFAHRCAQALPQHRPNVTDLNCGAGHLLQASALPSTDLVLGNDIDPARTKIEDLDEFLASVSSSSSSSSSWDRPAKGPRKPARPHSLQRLTCDLTRLYPFMAEIEFQADLFVLNPPWRLWWYRDRLRDLAHSAVPAVREAFAGVEEASPKRQTSLHQEPGDQVPPERSEGGTIDSTIATLLIALDRCSYQGEGMLIANNATLERLIFTPGAPHAAVAQHIWAHLVVPGNPMTGIQDCLWEKEDQFHTGVIYFARDHHTGPKKIVADNATDFAVPDRVDRMGSEICYAGQGRQDLLDDWNALKERVAEMNGQTGPTPFNLWLSATHHIRCNLSTFQQKSVKVDKQEAARLFALRNHTPMELVLQRAQRDELRRVLQHPLWKVDPQLIAAVDAAVTEYNAARAPLYPLPAIQRLGYLDEQDTITCRADLMGIPGKKASDSKQNPSPKSPASPASHPQPVVIFRAGEKYSLRTQTVNVTRTDTKPNAFTGEPEELEHSGQELAIYISDGVRSPFAKEGEDDGLIEYCFMDHKIQADQQTQVKTGKSTKHSYDGADPVAINFTLQQLADHFDIPEVPDVATTNPEGYRKNLDLLTEIEDQTEALAG